MHYDSKEVILNVPPKAEFVYTGRAVYAPFAEDSNGLQMYSAGRVGMMDSAGSNQVLVTPSKSFLLFIIIIIFAVLLVYFNFKISAKESSESI